jgi:hypothetical protein
MGEKLEDAEALLNFLHSLPSLKRLGYRGIYSSNLQHESRLKWVGMGVHSVVLNSTITSHATPRNLAEIQYFSLRLHCRRRGTVVISNTQAKNMGFWPFLLP